MTTTDVERADGQQKPPPTLGQLIKNMQPEIAKVLPNQMSPERMARIAATVVRQTPQLARCEPLTVLGALMTASQLGLEPGPIGEAYLVPFNTKSGMVCQFIAGYRGLIKLARNSGQLVDIWAEVVYEADEFSVTYGLHRDLVHVPKMGAERGEPIYVYAAAELKDGGRPFVVMTYAEVEAIRARSRASKNGPWVTDWAAMAKKTAIKQLAKWLPLSAEFNTATVLDGSARTDVGPLVDVQPSFVDGEVADEQAAIGGSDQPESAGDDQGALEVVLASKQQLAQLAQIRKAEKYDADADWHAYLADVFGIQVTRDADITATDAAKVIAEFNGDSAK